MFTKIKEFLFGKDPVQSPVATPYKVETPAPKVEEAPVAEAKVEVVPLGTEATIAAPAAVTPKAEPKPKAPAKPKAEPKPKAAPKAAGKPKAPVNSAAK
jgi:hypothetical protein